MDHLHNDKRKELKKIGWKGLQITEKTKPALQLMAIFSQTVFIEVTQNKDQTCFQNQKEYSYF